MPNQSVIPAKMSPTPTNAESPKKAGLMRNPRITPLTDRVSAYMASIPETTLSAAGGKRPRKNFTPVEAFPNSLGSYVVDGVLMGYNPLISNEEQIFKRRAYF
jgi:hypothetical protein